MQNCVLRMLAFRQISSFIWRSNLMSKKEASQRRFCEWGLNSYKAEEHGNRNYFANSSNNSKNSVDIWNGLL